MAVERRLRELVGQIGRAGVNAQFPNDIELYLITLELTDYLGKTIEYLSFPVSPSRINYELPSYVNIQKTLGGISALDTDTFVPRTVTLEGNFGRNFKLLINPNIEGAEQSSNSTTTGNTDLISFRNKGVFDARVKTGYGVLKVLESIIEKSKGVNEGNGQSNRLYLYNPALGHNWLVKHTGNLVLSQDKDASNGIWNYSLELTAIAPTDRGLSFDNIAQTLVATTAFNQLTATGSNLARQFQNL